MDININIKIDNIKSTSTIHLIEPEKFFSSTARLPLVYQQF